MKSSRVLTVYLTLAALLLGNVVGWMHVGCNGHHGSACCSAETMAALAKADDSPRTGHRHCHCQCDHGDGSGAASKSAGQTNPCPPADGGHESDSDHDSDRCTICQNFFASRHAVALPIDAPPVEAPMLLRSVVWFENVFVPATLCWSDTVRGPPRV